MKKLLKFACLLLVIIIVYCFFFVDEGSKSVTNDDKITLVFDKGYLSPYNTNDQLKTLLKRAGVNLGADDRFLIQDTPDFENQIITFYLPKNSITPQQKTYITERLENIRESYLSQKLKLAKNYDLTFELAIENSMTPRGINIEKLIEDKEHLKRFKADTARYNKHYDVTIKLGAKNELVSSAFGIPMAKVCAVKLDGIPELNYTELDLTDYLTEKTKKQFFNYTYNRRNKKIALPLKLKNVTFKDKDSEFVKQLASQPNKYKIVLVPITQRRPINSFNNHYAQTTTTPTRAVMYLTYDTVKMKPSDSIAKTAPCVWPADFVEPDPDDKRAEFAHLIGYQLDTARTSSPSSTP